MATYVPNVNPYLPNIKAFTPDYKFLTDTLQQRQTKYDSNYKQLNNAYSKIMYAGLSREDTKEARDQFVNNLQPELEKISGLDLSLGQNVKAAQAVFQPFYDNDLVMKDMVMTKDYQNKIALARDLKTSSDEKENDRYWDEGVKLLKYKMDDFINASQEDALRTSMPSYIENPQLYKRAMSYLKEQGYKVKYDTLSPGGDFIVTDTNGKNITSTALADLKRNFQNNDVIKNGYYTKSYVDSRQYAENQMQAGKVSSISEGILKYNKGNIQVYKEMNIANSVKYEEQVNSINKDLETIESELKKQGRTPKPNSQISKQIELMKNRVEGLTAQKEMALKTAQLADNILTNNDSDEINNKGYNVQMQSNMLQDLNAAATNYSMLTAERTFKVNQAELQRRKEVHDVKMSNIRFQQNKLLKEKETTEQEKRLKTKIRLNLEAGLNADGSTKKAGETNFIQETFNKLVGGVKAFTKTTEIVESTTTHLENQENYLADRERDLSNSQIENYIQVYSELNKKGLPNMVELPESFTLTAEEENNKKIINNKVYVNQDMFRKIASREENFEKFQEAQANIYRQDNNEKLTAFQVNPILSKLNTDYINKKEQETLIKKQASELYKNQEGNLQIVLDLEGKKGIPTIFGKNEEDDFSRLSKKEFEEKYIEYISSLDVVDEKTYELVDKGYSPKNPYILKPKNDPIWNKLRNGEIKPYIKFKDKNSRLSNREFSIINPSLVLRTNSGKTYMSIGKSEADKQLKEFVNNYPDPDNPNNTDVSYRVWGDYRTYGRGGKPKKGGYKLRPFKSTIPNIANKVYDNQLKTTQEINTNGYQDAGEGEIQQNAFKYVNYISEAAGRGSAITASPDMYLGQSQTTAITNQDKDNPNSNSTEQGVFLFDALNAPGAIVSHQVETVKLKDRDSNEPVQLSNDNAKLQMFNILNKWSEGELDKNYDYNIEYQPALPGQANSSYKLIRTHNVKGTQSSGGKTRTQTYTISFPNEYDKNNLNPKNYKGMDLLSSLIDNTTKSYDRNFDNGSKINTYLSNGVWHINPTFYQYDVKSDDMIEIDISQSEFSDVSNYTNVSSNVATEKYLDYVNFISRWSTIQYNKQRDAQKIYNKALETNPDIKWEEVFKTK
jgi:hypothetical protein